MLWGKVKVDVVGAPRCVCDECACDEAGGLADGPYRGTVACPIEDGSSLAFEMYEVAVAAEEARAKERASAELAKRERTLTEALPSALSNILTLARSGTVRASVATLVFGTDKDSYCKDTLVEALVDKGFRIVPVGAGGPDQVTWDFGKPRGR